jgi:hypothetical protein
MLNTITIVSKQSPFLKGDFGGYKISLSNLFQLNQSFQNIPLAPFKGGAGFWMKVQEREQGERVRVIGMSSPAENSPFEGG